MDNGLGSVARLVSVATTAAVSVVVGERMFVQPFSSGGKSGWDEIRRPQVWTSTDGLAWQPVDIPANFTANFVQVIAGGPGFAAAAVEWEDVGARGPRSHFFTSADGREWALTGSAGGRVERMAAVDGGLVAFGTKDGQSAAWVSNGGSGWMDTTDPSAAAVAHGLMALHNDASGLLAVRTDPSEHTPTAAIETWRSGDGESWTKAAELPRSAPVGDDWIGAEAWIASGPAGWVLVAGRSRVIGPSEIVVEWFAWHSSDGVDWQLTDSAPDHVTAILADDAGFMATGRDYGGCCAYEESQVQGVMWVSDDGRGWRQLSEEGWFGREIDLLRRDGETVIGLGIDWTLSPSEGVDLGTGAVWTIDRSLLRSAE